MSSRLSVKLDNFNFNKKDEDLLMESGFFQLKWKRKSYIITSHSFLPIKNNIYLENIKLNICINCLWNELLILKFSNDNKDSKLPEDVLSFDKIAIKVPSIGNEVYIRGNRLIIQKYCFSETGFIEKYPKTVYMKLKINSKNNFLIGDPVYCDQNKLQGIVSFFDDNYIYCLPSYYLIKTFEKENNFKIPTVDQDIVRINRNIVKNGMIFNPYLGIHIPLTSYLVLEENREIEAYCDDDDSIPLKINFRDYHDLPIIDSKRNLLKDSKGYYSLTSCSLHLMKKIYPQYMENLAQIINTNEKINKMKFKIHKNYLKVAYTK